MLNAEWLGITQVHSFAAVLLFGIAPSSPGSTSGSQR
jgi:hypothetical protein